MTNPDRTTSDASAATPAPTGIAAVAAATLIAAANLCAALARQDDVDGASVQAVALRERAGALALANATAFATARQLLDRPSAPGAGPGLGTALAASADALTALTETAADLAVLARELADRVGPDRRPDALGTIDLMGATAATLARLVEVNLAVTPADPRRDRVLRAVALAGRPGAPA